MPLKKKVVNLQMNVGEVGKAGEKGRVGHPGKTRAELKLNVTDLKYCQ